MHALEISVVVVNWNSKDDLRACLRSLEAQTLRPFEIIVVDNGSADGSEQMLRAEFPAVVVEQTHANLGFAGGVDRGIARARGAWIALLNNDAEADPRWLEVLAAAAAAGDDRLGMLQSCVLFRARPDRTNSTGVLLFPDGNACDRGFDEPKPEQDGIEEVFCVTAGAALYRRAMLDDVRLPSGVFDRTFFMYFEDVDLGWRCRLAGWDALYVPDAVVHHALYGSSQRMGGHFVEAHCKRNRIRMMLKNASVPFLVRGLRRTVLDVAELVSWEGADGLRGVARAVRDGLTQRREVSQRVVRSRRAVERRWVRGR